MGNEPTSFNQCGSYRSFGSCVGIRAGLLPSDCDSCKAEMTKIDALLQQLLGSEAFKDFVADCDNFDSEAEKDLCEKLKSEDHHAVVELMKSNFCTTIGACQVEQPEDIEMRRCFP